MIRRALACCLFAACADFGQAAEPQRVTVCELQSDPAAFNHKQVEVTGFVSHGSGDPKATLRGYGHFGCCSLLMIERVMSVEPQSRKRARD